MTTLVERIYRAVKKRRPEALVSAAVFANDENAYTRRFQDWRRWLQMGILDVACPMAYSTDTAVFQKQIEVASTTAHGAKRQFGRESALIGYRLNRQSRRSTSRARSEPRASFCSLTTFTARPSELNPGRRLPGAHSPRGVLISGCCWLRMSERV